MDRCPRNIRATTWDARSDGRGRHAAVRGHVDDDFADGVTDGPVREGRREGRSRQARAGNEETSHYQLFYEEMSPYQLFLAVERCGQRILDGCMPQHATDAAGRVSPARYATLTQAGAHIVWGAGLVSGRLPKNKKGKKQPSRVICFSRRWQLWHPLWPLWPQLP